MSLIFKESPLGLMALATHLEQVCFLAFGNSKEDLLYSVRQDFPKYEIDNSVSDNHFTQEMSSRVISILSGHSLERSFDLKLSGSDFQLKIWRRLCQIPWGETRSYTQIAEDVGHPSAVRAVARACAMNRIAFLVPCHRVLGKDGRLAGYRWGIEVKRQLLRLERQALTLQTGF